MTRQSADRKTENRHEARWPAAVAVAAVGALYAALPSALSVGPRWLVFELVIVLLICLAAFPHKRHPVVNTALGIVMNTLVTGAILSSLVILVIALPQHKETPFRLLGSAGALWFANILVFALWYWRLDAGGPGMRMIEPGREGAFLFPQMTMHKDVEDESDEALWSPNFVDYLFLAFNTSTALSPTDTAVLSRWAKCLMMLQALMSMSIIALLASRVVNIL